MSRQTRLVNIDFSSSSLYIYNLFTVGTQEMISMKMRTNIIAAFVKSAPSLAVIDGIAL